MLRNTLTYETTQKTQIIPITKDLELLVKQSGIKNGTLIAYSFHTTLGLIIQEDENNLNQDIFNQLSKIVEDDNGHNYRHSCDRSSLGGKGNGPSHVRHLLVNQNLIIDLKNGKLNLGEWQSVGLIELDGPRQGRQILVKIISDN